MRADAGRLPAHFTPRPGLHLRVEGLVACGGQVQREHAFGRDGSLLPNGKLHATTDL